MNNDAKDIVSALDILNTTMSFGVNVPSLGKKVMFRQITTAQQKRLAKRFLIEDKEQIVYELLRIFKENCMDKDVVFENLTIVDLVIISLYSRIYSIGDDVTLVVRAKEEDPSQDDLEIKLKLSKICENIEKMKDLQFDRMIEVEGTPYKFHCKLPTYRTIMSDYSPETAFDSDVRDCISYIHEIIIVNGEQEKKIDFLALNQVEKNKVFERFPAKVMTTIREKTKESANQISDLTLFDITRNNIKYRQTINPFDYYFFI
jgi:hypothetical protein